MCKRYNSRFAKARFVVFEGLMKENAQLVQSLLDEGAKIIDHKVAHSGNGALDNYAVSVLYVPNYFTVEEYEAASVAEVAETREKVREDIEAAETIDGAPTAEPDVVVSDFQAAEEDVLNSQSPEPDVTGDAIDGLQKQVDEADEAEKADEADERR